MHVSVWVTAEGRHKANEVVLGRPDVAAVVLYRPGQTVLETEVALIREFRSPAATPDGTVWEVPGGSRFEPEEDPLLLATEELQEEVGLKVDAVRVRSVRARQVAATLSTHKAHLFAVRLLDEELEALRRQEADGASHGVAKGTERDYVRVRSVRQLLAGSEVDWSSLGMVMAVLAEEMGRPE